MPHSGSMKHFFDHVVLVRDVEYYKTLLNKETHQSIPQISAANRLKDVDNQFLCAEVTVEEITHNLKHMKSDGSLGLDVSFNIVGMSSKRTSLQQCKRRGLKELLQRFALCSLDEGVMGIRFWEIATNLTSLWVKWVTKRYFNKQNIWEVHPSTTSSWIWPKFLASHTWIKPEVQYVIFSGREIKAWKDPWIHGDSLRDRYQHLLQQELPDHDISVAQFITAQNWVKPSWWPGEWDAIWTEIANLDCGRTGFIWAFMVRKMGVRRPKLTGLKQFVEWLENSFPGTQKTKIERELGTGEANKAIPCFRSYEQLLNFRKTSSVWKSIIKAGSWVKVATQYVIFSGKTINLWSDPWFQGNDLQHLFQGPPLLNWGPSREVTLCTLLRDVNGTNHTYGRLNMPQCGMTSENMKLEEREMTF
ncbi:hypothetical protein QJS10_CPB15g00982 [Acorus calamus]|uniref:Uncharacterized protein n=1 Tax=Acorus calamus TaxID=4465 RepID=A0AAV9D6A9_ACOCL|nr:hypothetical protein QJS10_CPB15g00982 [Acorus calamus]